MAKKQSSETGDEAAISIADRIERQQQAQLVKSAQSKISAGDTPTKAELSAFRKFEKATRAKHGQAYLRAMPKGDFLDTFGGSSKVYIEWHNNYGFPWRKKAGEVSLVDVLQWYRKQFIDGPVVDGEDFLLQTASQALKDSFVRERIREKEITNRLKEIELQRTVAGLVPLEPIRQWHNSLAALLARTRERLAREADAEHREAIEQAFDDLSTDMERMIEERFGDGHDSQ